MSKAADEEILDFAVGKNSIVVTLDSDFHAILAVSGAAGPSVIRMVTVKARKTTSHRLPIGRSA